MVSMDKYAAREDGEDGSKVYITNVAKRFLPIHHDVRGIVRVLVIMLRVRSTYQV